MKPYVGTAPPKTAITRCFPTFKRPKLQIFVDEAVILIFFFTGFPPHAHHKGPKNNNLLSLNRNSVILFANIAVPQNWRTV